MTSLLPCTVGVGVWAREAVQPNWGLDERGGPFGHAIVCVDANTRDESVLTHMCMLHTHFIDGPTLLVTLTLQRRQCCPLPLPPPDFIR